ncbi:MAG: transposase [Bacteroidota bacterium]|nr:transposase [Bacteroidota bacterium]
MKQDFFEPGVVYHVFNRGNNKEDIFKEEKNYVYFLSLIQKHLLPVAEIYAYCLLKNHFHLALRIKDEPFLDDKYKQKPYLAFSNLFNAYTKSINKLYNRTGSLFQEHLHRKRVEDEAYLTQLIAYIHLNPVKHAFSDDFKSYRYSSYQAYTTRKSTNLSCDYVMSLFEDRANFEYWHDLNKLYLEDNMEDI